ncbi:MAG TPA: hypothetical protein PKC72_14970 [Chitinophagaceae bacterium]|nr:hypothetical protein [Chitinophagaceae bacterium]
MKKTISWATLIILIFWGINSSAQRIKTVDFIKILNGKEKEALFFYENNWKAFREEALQKGYINSFEILKTRPDSSGDFDLVLLTEYPDSNAYKQIEDHFKEFNKNRKLSPEIQKNLEDRKNFSKYLFGKNAEVIFRSNRKE